MSAWASGGRSGRSAGQLVGHVATNGLENRGAAQVHTAVHTNVAWLAIARAEIALTVTIAVVGAVIDRAGAIQTHPAVLADTLDTTLSSNTVTVIRTGTVVGTLQLF